MKQLFLFLFLAPWAFASGGDEMITVHFSGSGAFVQTGNPTYNQITFNVIEGRVAADPSIALRTQTASVSGSYGPAGMETPYVDLRAEVGRDYIMWMTATSDPESGDHIPGSGNFHVRTPPGYRCVFINQDDAFYPGTVYRFRIIPEVINESPMIAGEAESFADGRLAWSVSLGTRSNGTSSGSIRLKDFSYETNWNGSGSPFGLKFVTDLKVYEPGTTGPKQLKSEQALVEIVTLSSTKYKMEFYSSDDVTGSGYPYTTVSGAYPFVVYEVEKPSGFSTKLVITKNTYGDNSATPVRIESTSLQRSGTWVASTSNYTWTKEDWHTGSTALVTRTDAWGNPTAASNYEYTNSYSVSQPVQGTALSGTKKTNKFPWGEDITEVSLGGLTTSYEYYENSTNLAQYSRLKKVTYPDGSYESYDYFSNGENGMAYGGHTVTRPHSNGTETTTYWYEEANPAYPQRLDKVETAVGNQTISLTEFTYDSSFSANSLPIVRTTREDYASSTSDLDTITQYYLGPNDGYSKGQLFSVQRPDFTKTVFAYHVGAWDDVNKSFSLSSPDGSFRIARIHGTADPSSTGANAPALDSYSLTSSDSNDLLKLEDGISTMEVEIRDENALLVRTENHVWDNSAWHLVWKVDYEYDDHLFGRLDKRDPHNNSLYTAGYSNGLLSSETLPSGVIHSYSNHDAAGRPLTVTREALGGTIDPVPAVVTTYKYDALNHIVERKVSGGSESLTYTWEYDSAGRLTSQSNPDTGVQSIGYVMLSEGGSERTITRTPNTPTAATRIEKRNTAGQLVSVTGTGVIHQHFSYAIPSGQQKTTVRIGADDSPRMVESWTDWLGRPAKTSQPGFAGQPSLVTEQEYNARGQLIAERTTGSSEIQEFLYEYDTAGRLVRSGIDVDQDANNALSLSADRVTSHDSRIEWFDGAWWSTQRTAGYFEAGQSTSKPVSTTRSRLTGFPTGTMSETRVWDADYDDTQPGSQSSKTTVTVDLSAGAKKVTTKTWTGSITNPEVQITQNGALTKVLGSYSTAETDAHTFSYDSLSRPIKSTDPRTGTTTTTTYNTDTSLVSGTTRLIGMTVGPSPAEIFATAGYTYDGAGRLTTSTDESGAVMRRQYDLLNRLAHQWGDGANPVAYGYDATYGDRTTMSTYRNGSNWNNSTWPGTGTPDITQWNYHDASGMLWYKTAADGQAVVYGYDHAGRLAKRSWARRKDTTSTNPQDPPLETTYLYAPRTGELTNKNYNDSVTTDVSYTYTRTGQLKTVNDALGQRTLTYNGASPWRLETDNLAGYLGNRQLKRVYTSTALVGMDGGYELGTSGNPTADVSHTWNYDTVTGRVDNVIHSFEGTARTFAYSYEAKSHLLDKLSVVHAGGTYEIDRGWDTKRNLLTELKSGFTGQATAAQFNYAYDARGKRDWETRQGTSFTLGGSAVTIDYQYTTRGELSKALTYLGSDSAIGNSSLALGNLQHEYAYDNAGNRTSANQTGSAGDADASTFDATNQHTSQQNKRLIAAGTVQSSSTMAVALDNGSPSVPTRQASGTYWTASFDPANTSAAITTDVKVWAANGGTVRSESVTTAIGQETQTITYADPSKPGSPGTDGNLMKDGIWDYNYDAENRLTSATSTLLSTTVSFVYDYLGRRAQKTVAKTGQPTVTRRFVYDGWDLIGEYEYDSSVAQWWPVQAYAWGLNNASAKTHTGAAGALLQITHQDSRTTTTPKHYLPAYDANGNLMALYDAATKTEAAVYEYSPYGELLRATGDFANLNPFRYSTKYTDNETGLVYFGHRYYSPKLGRFINRDPIEEAGGNNLLGYVGNDPVNREDTLGLIAKPLPQILPDIITPRTLPPPRRNPFVSSGGVYVRQVLGNTREEELAIAAETKLRDQYTAESNANAEKNRAVHDQSRPRSPAISHDEMEAASNSLRGSAPKRAIARQDSVMAEIIDDIFNIRGVNRVDYERERELRAKYGKYIDYVNDPDNPSIIFASTEEANTAAALLAAVRGGAYMEKEYSFSDGEYRGQRSSYGSEEYIWGVVRVNGGFRPTRAITNGKGARVDPADNPAIIAARSAGTLAGIGHNHPPGGNHPEVMSGYGDYGSYRGDRTVAEQYRVPIFMTSPSGTHYRGTATKRPVPVTAGPSGGDFYDLIGILKP